MQEAFVTACNVDGSNWLLVEMDLERSVPTYVSTEQLVSLIGDRFFIADQRDDRLQSQQDNRLRRKASVEVRL